MFCGGGVMNHTIQRIFHIDVNAAFLSWEAVHRLQMGEKVDLRTIPSAVSGDKKARKGIILAKSLPTKKYGIITGEPVVTAQQKCPNLYLIAPVFERYKKASDAFYNLLCEYSDNVLRYSIDECFIDVTGHSTSDLIIAENIRRRIKDQLGFTVSIGISQNKLLAKMASELKKPDAISTIYPHEIQEKMWGLPIENLFMAGRATQSQMKKFGIRTIGDFATMKKAMVKTHFKSFGLLLWAYANGKDAEIINISKDIKSIGNSSTLSHDVSNEEEAHHYLLSITETVATRLRRTRQLCRLVTITIKDYNFNVTRHQHQFDFATDSTEKIYQRVILLFDYLWNGQPIRLLGVSVGDLYPAEQAQINLFDLFPHVQKKEKVDHVIDSLREQFHPDIIMRGSFIKSDVKNMIGLHKGSSFRKENN